MTDANEDSSRIAPPGNAPDTERLPLRDWILLPAISLLTIVLIVVSAQLFARRIYTRTDDFATTCVDLGDATTGTRAKPNSSCRFKTYESQLDEYRFNSCGHRTAGECSVKQQGTYRIVMAGSSVAMGYEVPLDKTYGWLLPMRLSQVTGRRIELYNEALLGHGPSVLALHFDDILKARPDLILWTIVPFDIDTEKTDVNAALPKPDEKGGRVARSWSIVKGIFAAKPLPEALGFVWELGQRRFTRTPVGALLVHTICQSNSQYVRSNLMAEDTQGYLRTQPSEDWQRRLASFDKDMAKIESQAKAAGIPLVVVFIPSRVQAVMVSMGQWPAGYDPYQLDNELRTIVERHQASYIDTLPLLRNLPSPEDFYYPADGHPDAAGHAAISDLLARQLTSGAVPAFSAVMRPQGGSEQGR